MSPEIENSRTLETIVPRRGYAMVLMVACSVVISFGGLIIRNIEVADALQINFYRSISLIGAVMVILLIQYRRKTISHVVKIGVPGIIGGIVLAGAGIAFLQSMTHTTIANSLFTMGTIPFITAGLARIFLKEHLKRITIITMIMAGVGIFFMIAEGVSMGSGYGNAMAMVTAVCFASFTVIVRHNRGIDMLPSLLVSGVIIALISVLFRYGSLEIPIRDILLCFLWGGVLSGFANWAFILATRHMVAAEVTLFMMLEFTLGPLWVWLFIDEIPTWGTLVGGAIIIASVGVLTTSELRSQGKKLKRGRPSPT